jgi:uncharacterized protein YjbI with pentapeptide repeats
MSQQYTLRFGDPDEWAEFAKTHPLFVERFANLRTALDVAFTRTGDTSNPTDRVVFFSGRLCAEEFFEITLLCGNGYGVGGWKILRSMYERAVTATYLHSHPEEADAFLDFHCVSMHKLEKAIEDTIGKDVLPSEKGRQNEADYQRVKDRFMVADCKKCGTMRLNYTWTTLDFVSMAKAAGEIGKLLVPAYYLPLRHAHSTVGAILDRLEESELGGLAFNPGPQRPAATAALRCAHAVLLNVLELQRQHFNLESLNVPLERCTQDFRDIWNGTGTLMEMQQRHTGALNRCTVDMSAGPCGRPIYQDGRSHLDPPRVCLMHSSDPEKSDSEFQNEFESILRRSSSVDDFTGFVFPHGRLSVRCFKRPCIFRRAKFLRGTDFVGVIFEQRADFGCAVFENNASFDQSEFRCFVDFSHAVFEKVADLREGIFEQDACFIGTSFGGSALFDKAHFRKLVTFRFAEFGGPARFLETEFAKNGSFDPTVVFWLTNFSEPESIIFYKTYLGQAVFRNCDVSRVVFSDVAWRRRPRTEKWFLFDEVVDTSHPQAEHLKPAPGDPNERNYKLIAELYHQLKKNYDSRGDYWSAGNFHWGELEMLRLSTPCKQKTLRRLHRWLRPAAWYRRFNSYGESWARPLLWLLGALGLFGFVVYPAAGLVYQGEPPCPHSPDYVQTVWHSITTFLCVAALQRNLTYEPSYPWGRICAALEVAVTSGLIALFLLAVRRQFRR